MFIFEGDFDSMTLYQSPANLSWLKANLLNPFVLVSLNHQPMR